MMTVAPTPTNSSKFETASTISASSSSSKGRRGSTKKASGGASGGGGSGKGASPKYQCRACGEMFPNWSQCLAHVRGMEMSTDPELHKLTLTPEGRRELQKICKYSGSTTSSPNPSPTQSPMPSPVYGSMNSSSSSSSSSGISNSTSNSNFLLPNQYARPTINGNNNNNTNMMVSYPVSTSSTVAISNKSSNHNSMLGGGSNSRQQHHQQQPSYGITNNNTGFFVGGDMNNNNNNNGFVVNNSFTSVVTGKNNYAPVTNPRLNGNYFSEQQEDRASVCSFSSVSISPESTPASSPRRYRNAGFESDPYMSSSKYGGSTFSSNSSDMMTYHGKMPSITISLSAATTPNPTPVSTPRYNSQAITPTGAMMNTGNHFQYSVVTTPLTIENNNGNGGDQYEQKQQGHIKQSGFQFKNGWNKSKSPLQPPLSYENNWFNLPDKASILITEFMELDDCHRMICAMRRR